MPDRLQIPRLFPEWVAHTGMPVQDGASLPDGMRLPPLLSNAVRPRLEDYVAGRLCAREAMRLLGVPAVDIPMAEDGDPVWPLELVGSITHAHGQAFAAVARRSKALSIGIDVERRMQAQVARQLAPLVAVAQESERLSRQLAEEDLLVTIIFSVKETIFKCLFPILQFRFDFSEIEVLTADIDSGTFTCQAADRISRLLPKPLALTGRIALVDDCVHTGVVLET